MAMSIEPHLLAERTVPRYTSYPTAPHFTAAVDGGVYADWLAQTPAGTTLSLYLHVPFCRQLCHYCGCHTKAMRQQAAVDAYAEALKAEIGLLARHLGRRPVAHIHWGGGTPSILGGDQLQAVTEHLHRSFDLGALREHAIELDPRHVDSGLVAALAAMGVNRTSLGVQEFSPQVQQAIGRIQPYELVARSVDLLRAHGIDGINFDLMYGLPRQTVADVCASAERTCALKPQRVALFGYAHVPWFKKHQRLIDAAELPGARARLEQMEAARAVFLSGGYEPVGLDHFALPGDTLIAAAKAGALRRNFQGYTSDGAGALIGIGASAIGRLQQGFAQNAVDAAGYARAVAAGRFATAKGVALSADDRLRGAIIERIMCNLRVDLREFADAAAEGFERELELIRPYVRAGLAECDDGVVQVTERGRAFVRLIAAAFDAYRRENAGVHSQAV